MLTDRKREEERGRKETRKEQKLVKN